MGTERLANLLVMGVCVNCGGALEDRWKFCIFCGTPVQAAPISEPAPEPAPEPAAEPADEPDAGAGIEPKLDVEPAAGDDGESAAEPEPARPPIPSAIRTFVPMDIPNEEEDDPAVRQIRPRLRPRGVDVPLLLGIALGIAGVVLVIYVVAVLSGQE